MQKRDTERVQHRWNSANLSCEVASSNILYPEIAHYQLFSCELASQLC